MIEGKTGSVTIDGKTYPLYGWSLETGETCQRIGEPLIAPLRASGTVTIGGIHYGPGVLSRLAPDDWKRICYARPIWWECIGQRGLDYRLTQRRGVVHRHRFRVSRQLLERQQVLVRAFLVATGFLPK